MAEVDLIDMDDADADTAPGAAAGGREFIIPVHTEDLELARGDRFCVEAVANVEVLDADAVTDMLDELTEALLTRGSFAAVTDNQTFDPIYSLLRYFPTLNAGNKERLLDLLDSVLRSALPAVQKRVPGQPADAALRTPVKMVCFLLCTAVQVAESNAVHEAKEEASTKAVTGAAPARGRKKAAASADKFAGVWPGVLAHCLSSLMAFVQAAFETLWPVSVPEEEFLNLFIKTAFRVLENPNNAREKPVRLLCVKMIACLSHKFQVILPSVSSGVIHRLNTLEHISTAMAELLSTCVNDYGDNTMVGDVLREIGRIDTSETRDTAGMKNMASFLPEVAKEIPAAVLANVSVLLPHLDGESYAMRSAVVSCLGCLVEYTAAAARQAATANDAVQSEDMDGSEDTTQSAASQSTSKTRDALFDVLQERVYDVNAFTRAAVQRSFGQLVANGSVPLSRVHAVTGLAADRLKDKASVVRKAAMGVLRSMLESNPFGGVMDVAAFESQLQTIEAWLRDNGPGAQPATIAEEKSESDVDDSETESPQRPQQQPSESGEIGVTAEQLKYLRARDYCVAAMKFAMQMQEATQTVVQLLGSKAVTDVMEAMRFLETAHAFHLPGAAVGISKMLALVWSGEKSIKEELLVTFRRLYVLQPGSDDHALPPKQIAANLVNLTIGTSLAVRTSLEEILRLVMFTDGFPKATIRCLWDLVHTEATGNNQPDLVRARAAMSVISMLAGAHPAAVSNSATMQLLLQQALGMSADATKDLRLARHACVAVARAATQGDSSLASTANDFVAAVSGFVTGKWDGGLVDDAHWYGATEAAMNAVFLVHSKPHIVATQWIHALHGLAFGAKGTSAAMSRLFFALGHVAVKTVVLTERVGADIKKVKTTLAEEKTKAKAGAHEQRDAIEVELGLTAAEEERDAERVLAVCEKDIVGRNLLGMYGPLIVKAVGATLEADAGVAHSRLHQSAVLALCKFMGVSAEFCDKNLQLLFSILKNVDDAQLRETVVIALGDLAFRFPNLIEPWIASLYGRLRDANTRVRKTTLMALSHLILNDMVKLRGQAADIALCLIDSDERIQDLTKLFFNELSKRGDNPIYNVLPDALSALANDRSVSQETFCVVMKFLLSYVSKEKHMESLVDRLSQRFQTTEDVNQWRGLAFCLSQLRLNDKSCRKLVDNLRFYKAALADPQVLETMQEIAAKSTKSTKAGEEKDALQEWANVLGACQAGQSLDDMQLGDGTVPASGAASGAAADAVDGEDGDGEQPAKAVAKPAAKTKAGAKAAGTKARKPAAKAGAKGAKKKTAAKRRVVDSDSDEGDEPELSDVSDVSELDVSDDEHKADKENTTTSRSSGWHTKAPAAKSLAAAGGPALGATVQKTTSRSSRK